MRFHLFWLLVISASVLASTDKPAMPDPAESRIAAARSAVASNPKSWQPHIDLAEELCHKARDSEEISYYKAARAELDLALKISPGNYSARKVEASILLGEDDLSSALKLASELNRMTPDDTAVWALLAEINSRLGGYSEALRDAQWILDLRAGSALGFIEAAPVRADHGDFEGAFEFYQEALRRISYGDLVQRAWLLVQMGNAALQAGNIKVAGEQFESSLKINPQSRIAAAGLAKVRIAEGDYSAAVSILKERYEGVRDAHTLYELADALDRAGQAGEAKAAFASFEAMAGRAAHRSHRLIMDLIYYYADRKPSMRDSALQLAVQDSSVHRDWQTLAAQAWALYRNERYADARSVMHDALSVGVRDAEAFCRASRMSAAVDDRQKALEYATQANALRPNSCMQGQGQ
jgi:tetratricopeptide (TPR) repeat protein